ncbi:MAG: energy transducer TonB [Rhodothalassiaceae bacterium]
MTFMRYGLGLLVSVAVTFGLFYLMQSLVGSKRLNIQEEDRIVLIDPLAREREENVDIKRREPERPPEPEAPPPDLDINTAANLNPNALSLSIGGPALDASADIAGVGQAPSDGEYLPIVKIEPQYPRRAAERGIEGTCLVSYTVTPEGTTTDIQVVESECESIFARASIQAAEKFKYKPKVVNGEAIAVANVQNLFTYQLADGGRRR